MSWRSRISRVFGAPAYTPAEFGSMFADQRAEAFLANDGSMDVKISEISLAGSNLDRKQIRRELICLCCFADWTAFMAHAAIRADDRLLKPLLEVYINRVARHIYSAGLWRITSALTVEGIGPPKGGFHDQFYERAERYELAVLGDDLNEDIVGEIAGMCASYLYTGASSRGELKTAPMTLFNWFWETNWKLVDEVRIRP